MSLELINRSPDLKQLRDEGYLVQIKGSYLVLREIPYVDGNRQVQKGTLISTLNLAGDRTRRPETHVVHFDGSYPCNADGTPIRQISHQSKEVDLGSGVVAKHSFSSKPDSGYTDYYHKMTTYAAILAGPAAVLDPRSTPRLFRPPADDYKSIFQYMESASDRAGIGAVTELLAGEHVAIIGLGGTGSYILDFVAKTPVRKIHLFDGDTFLQHNAFRAPGAASIDELRNEPFKVNYFKEVYLKMHRGIVAHPIFISSENVDQLDTATFAFICLDSGQTKRLIIERLEMLNIAFVDVGLGLELIDGSLGGIVRVTTSTPSKREHLREKNRICLAPMEASDDLYSSNIQVADLNGLNAAMAVIKWKKLRGFYKDRKGEHHSTYTINGNLLLNDDFE